MEIIQQCSLHDMFTKKPNKSRIRSKVTNNQEKSTNLSLEWITCLPSKKKGQNCLQKTYSFDLLFPQKTEMTREKPKHFVQISITLLTKTTILSALFLTVDFFRQVTRCRAWTMHIFVGAILLEIWMFGQHLHRDKCRKVFGIYIYIYIDTWSCLFLITPT